MIRQQCWINTNAKSLSNNDKAEKCSDKCSGFKLAFKAGKYWDLQEYTARIYLFLGRKLSIKQSLFNSAYFPRVCLLICVVQMKIIGNLHKERPPFKIWALMPRSIMQRACMLA